MRNPLLILTVIFCAGILAGKGSHIWLFWLLGLNVLFLILSFLFSNKQLLCDIGLSALAFLLGMTVYTNQLIVPRDHICRLVQYNNKQQCVLEGYIEEDPRLSGSDTSFIMRVQVMERARLRQ
jgi:hypothetical protein